MKLNLEIFSARYRVCLDRAQAISQPVSFNSERPQHFGAATAQSNPMRAGGFVGDTRQGGSCNVPVLTLNPHCNGTHSESVAHIIDAPLAINTVIAAPLIPARLISVTPLPAAQVSDGYRPALNAGDTLITRAAIDAALANVDRRWCEALVIRTLPNSFAKRDGDESFLRAPAFFSFDAMQAIRELGVRHLLVDLPSLDRLDDDGILGAHRRYWRIHDGARALNADSMADASVTELIFVPDTLTDGPYLLNLQIPDFPIDVAPCRPILIPLEPDHA